MLIVGDVALGARSFDYVGLPSQFFTSPLVINLEGALVEKSSDTGVYSHSDRFDEFVQLFPEVVCCLANNHIDDFPDGLERTVKRLTNLKIETLGCARANGDPFLQVDDFLLLNVGWSVVGCTNAVDQLDRKTIVRAVEYKKAVNPRAKIVVVIHGNYELECYPQPLHRSLARKLVSVGAHAVIFHHSHRVGPWEYYNGSLIAYGIGNWAFAQKFFFEGQLSFPEYCNAQAAVEMTETGVVIHKLKFDPLTDTILYQGQESESSCDIIRLPDKEYTAWFKSNRNKARGLPIYHENLSDFTEKCLDSIVNLRRYAIDFSVRLGLKSQKRR